MNVLSRQALVVLVYLWSRDAKLAAGEPATEGYLFDQLDALMRRDEEFAYSDPARWALAEGVVRRVVGHGRPLRFVQEKKNEVLSCEKNRVG